MVDSGKERSRYSGTGGQADLNQAEPNQIDPGQTDHGPDIAAAVRPSEPQRRYLARGLAQAGGKLPLFDDEGQLISHQTVEACIAHGWAEPWVSNPIKPDWLVCRLTPAGYHAIGHKAPGT
jgi:hypothetical protein